MDPDLGAALDASSRRRYGRACAVGGLVAALLFTWMLCAGRADLLQSHELDNLYDAQAHALLDGHWDMPREELGIEAYIIDGKAYTYYGPVPAVMRMPVAAVTDRFDGRLTQLSMLGAFAVLIVFTSRLSWRVRALVRGGRPVGRAELWIAGAFVFGVGAGSVVLFLASRTIVYHEAELWGAAFALASYDFLLGFIVRPGRRDLTWAGVFAGLAFLTRPSVGGGPLAALGLVLLARLLVVVARRVKRDGLLRPLAWAGLGGERANRSYLAPLVAAVAVPLALYMYVNYARFGHPWNYPITRHITVLEGIDQMRIEALAANGNSLFGLKFVPTNLLVMLRPDGVGLDGIFPFVTFPPPADVIGGVKFDTIDRAASIPTTMPLLFVLALVGAAAVFLGRPRAASRLAALRVPVLGALAGGCVTLSINFVAHRYLSDFLPLLVLLGLAGVQVLLLALARPDRRRGVVRAVTVGLIALTALALWTNFALGILYQRAYNVFLSESDRAAFIAFQQNFDEIVPGGSRFDVGVGPELPDPGPAGSVFVVGDCDGLYWSDGEDWFGLERTDATGGYPLRVTLPDRPPGTRETLLVAGTPDKMDLVGVEYRDDGDVVFTIETGVFGGLVLRSEPVDIEPGRPTRVDVVYDNSRVGRFAVDVDGESVFSFNNLLAVGPVALAGSDDPGAPDFDGTVERLPTRTPLCRELVDTAR